MASSPPQPAAVRAALEKIVSSPGFADAGRLAPFLRHLVECALAGESGRVKESVLGVEVFQRPADYDPRVDPIVRVEARRLRQRLDEYYATAGHADPVRIHLPKGGYQVTFAPASPIPEPGVRPRPWWHYALGIAALALAGIALGTWQSRYMTRLRHAPIAKIAVLPFDNVGRDAANEPFSDGLTEELMERLSRTPGVAVIARSVMFQYKGRPADARKVAADVDASMVVEGSVRRNENRVRVTARLTNPRDGASLWSQTYEREMKDIFAIQDDIAQSIANALRIRLNAPVRGPASRYTENLAAYNAWLNGRYHLNLYSVEGYRRAVEYFDEAARLDPAYAPAYAGLARTYTMMGFYDAFAPGRGWDDARRAAEQAVSIDPALAEAHAARGVVLALGDWNWTAAEASFRKALELDETSAQAHGFLAISVLLPAVRLEEANREFKRALELDPLDIFVNYAAAFGLVAAGRYDDAVRQYHRTIELKAVHPNMYWDLGMAYGFAKRFDEARQAMRESRRLRGYDPDSIGGLDLYFSGDAAGARRGAEPFEREAAAGKARFMDVARLWSMLGEKPRALDALEKAVARHESEVPFLLVDPRLKPLAGDPRLTALGRKVGLVKP